MITIQICHANEVIHDGWKIVETLHRLSEIEEHLSSPLFEWSEGTCVRVEDRGETIYTAIYNATTLVDVGGDSDVSALIPWAYDNRSLDYLTTKGWIDAWVECEHPSWMFDALMSLQSISRVTDDKIILHCAYEMMQYACDHDDDTRSIVPVLLDGMRRYTLDQLPEGELNKIRTTIPRSVDQYDDMMRGIIYLYDSIINISYAKKVVYCALGVFLNSNNESQYEAAKTEMCGMIRKEIPFYDIARALTGNL